MTRQEAAPRLDRDGSGRLVLIDEDGGRHVGVTPVRAFPLSAPDRGIALCDEHGREVGWIDDLGTLPPASRQMVAAEIAANEFLPVITRIVRISSDSTPCEFVVETDRGPTRFKLDSDEQIRKIGPYRMILTDASGVRYHVPDIRQLDTAGRRGLERHL